jgi:hypothetical protein
MLKLVGNKGVTYYAAGTRIVLAEREYELKYLKRMGTSETFPF